jgi:hypothetical protein
MRDVHEKKLHPENTRSTGGAKARAQINLNGKEKNALSVLRVRGGRNARNQPDGLANKDTITGLMGPKLVNCRSAVRHMHKPPPAVFADSVFAFLSCKPKHPANDHAVATDWPDRGRSSHQSPKKSPHFILMK